jgi:hypothetical protein
VRAGIRRQVAHHRRTKRRLNICAWCHRIRIREVRPSYGFHKLPTGDTRCDPMDFFSLGFGITGLQVQIVFRTNPARLSLAATSSTSYLVFDQGPPETGYRFQRRQDLSAREDPCRRSLTKSWLSWPPAFAIACLWPWWSNSQATDRGRAATAAERLVSKVASSTWVAGWNGAETGPSAEAADHGSRSRHPESSCSLGSDALLAVPTVFCPLLGPPYEDRVAQ